MPTYIRPARVTVTEDGSGLGALVLLLAAALAVAAVVAFVVAHLVLLAAAAAVFVAVAGGLAAWMRWLASPRRLQEHRARYPARVPSARPARAIPASRPKVIGPPAVTYTVRAVAEDKAAVPPGGGG